MDDVTVSPRSKMAVNPLRGLGELTWLEIKIFLREPLGAIGTIVVPVLVFIVLGRAVGRGATLPSGDGTGLFGAGGVPAFVSAMIAISAVLSLVTIVSIYREGGILKRLRATPLRPYTILTAHVLVKLLLTAVTMTLLIAAGKRYFAIGSDVPVLSAGVALLICTWSILSVGFVIASIVPTARFAQPIGAVILYPMLALSGLFAPIATLPPALQAVAKVLPLTYTVRLVRGVWNGEPWSAHLGDVAALALVFVICTAISGRVFRWE
jgi:ABC-2 type transport system permease protein